MTRASRLVLPDHFAADNRCDRAALELAAVKRRIARLARRILHVVSPRAIRRKNRDVAGLARGERSLLAEHARRAVREELDHAHQRNTTGVYKLLERKCNRR